MKNSEDFHESLSPSLQKLEDFRLSQIQANKNALWYYVLPAIIAVGCIPVYWKINPVMAFLLFIIAVTIAVQISFNETGKALERYSLVYFKNIFPLVLKAFCSKVSFSVKNKIPKKTFLFSGLFPSAEVFNGKHLFKGTDDNGYKFRFSNLEVLYKTSIDQSDTLFKGWFFEIDTPHPFETTVKIFPSKSISSNNPLDFLSSDENPIVDLSHFSSVFNKDFTVFSNSANMTEFLLTPDLIDSIYSIEKKWKTKPSCSFIDNKIFVAIPSEHNLFFSDINDVLIQKYFSELLYQDLLLCFGIIEDFGNGIKVKPEENSITDNSAHNLIIKE